MPGKKKPWICPICDKPCTAGVACTQCRLWIHYKCSGFSYKDIRNWTKCELGNFSCPSCNTLQIFEGRGGETPAADYFDETPTEGMCDVTPTEGKCDETPSKGISDVTHQADVCYDTPTDGITDVTSSDQRICDATPTEEMCDETPTEGITDVTFSDQGICDATPTEEMLDFTSSEGICDETLTEEMRAETLTERICDETLEADVCDETPKVKTALVICTSNSKMSKGKESCDKPVWEIGKNIESSKVNEEMSAFPPRSSFSLENSDSEEDYDFVPKFPRLDPEVSELLGNKSKKKGRPVKPEKDEGCSKDVSGSNKRGRPKKSQQVPLKKKRGRPKKSATSDDRSALPSHHKTTDTLEVEEVDLFKGSNGRLWVKDNNQCRRKQHADIIPSDKRPGLRPQGKVTSEIEAFFAFFDPVFIKEAVFYTNIALKCTRDIAKSKSTWDKLKSRYEDTNAIEIRTLFGLLMIASKYDMSYADLWFSSFAPPFFAAAMSHRRFAELMMKLRFDDPATRAKRRDADKFAAMRSVFDRFAENLSKFTFPTDALTVDEMLLSYRGHKCSFVVYMKDKPDSYGIKFWVLADANQRFVYNIQPYLGSDGEPEKGQGERVVMDMIQPIKHLRRGICADNFFTSLDLLDKLQSQHNLTYTGTIKVTRVGLPPFIVEKGSREPGDVRYAYSGKIQAMSLIADNKSKRNVIIVTSGSSSEDLVPVQRKDKSIVMKTYINDVYNNEKVGVDAIDQICSGIGIKPRSTRWNMTVLGRMIEISIVNSTALFNLEGNPGFLNKLSISDMIETVGMQFIKVGIQMRPMVGLKECVRLKVLFCRQSMADVPKSDEDNVADIKFHNERLGRQRCFMCCAEKSTRKAKNNVTKTKNRCDQCNKSVCLRHATLKCQTCVHTIS